MQTTRTTIDGLPLTLTVPGTATGDLVLWVTHLGGSAQQTEPTLERIAEAGHPAISFDPPRHGDRSDGGDPWVFALNVLASFRRSMWPIVGQTTLEAMRVLTWGQEQMGQVGRGVRAGGVSMGGDVAIALAGIDDRVTRVATLGSTPNWSRPGMRDLMDPEVEVDQGQPDRYAEWFGAQLDPARHLDRYARGIPIDFELGEDDLHIPAQNAQQFRDDLTVADPMAAGRTEINLRSGLDHFGITSSEVALSSALTFLLGG